MYRGLKDPTPARSSIPVLRPEASRSGPTATPPRPFPIPIAHYKWLVFADPKWDWRTFEFTDPAGRQAFLKAESKFAPILNATDPNLREFRRRGGKLIQYHGWNDQLIAPQNSIDYYESVLSFFGGRAGRARPCRTCRASIGCTWRPGWPIGRRTRSERIRPAGGAGAVGGTRHRAGGGRRDAFDQRRRRSLASAVPVPEGGRLQRQRGYERRRELRCAVRP